MRSFIYTSDWMVCLQHADRGILHRLFYFIFLKKDITADEDRSVGPDGASLVYTPSVPHHQLFHFHPPVLEPDFNLPLGQV